MYVKSTSGCASWNRCHIPTTAVADRRVDVAQPARVEQRGARAGRRDADGGEVHYHLGPPLGRLQDLPTDGARGIAVGQAEEDRVRRGRNRLRRPDRFATVRYA